ncbi:MAG: filamentous hemagglutinin N-terminal domain-containing protein [Cyanobacteria bacterium P01_G01_bin.67]
MKPNNYLLSFSSSIIVSCLAMGIPAQAQISADDSLSLPTEVIQQSDNLVEIVGGTEAGINLFHSFAKFSVSEGDIARFINNNSEIQNVIGRITGASASEIFGQISSGGTAPNFDLFLLNPNGIIFGSDAALDLNGSFVATTANAIQFGDRGFFDASSTQDSSQLTVQPSALFFNQINPKAIVNQSSYQTETMSGELSPVGLQVPRDRSLLLIGGDVTIDGGMLTAPNGRVELGGLAETGTVAVNIDHNNLSVSFPNDVARSNVLLNNGAKIDVSDRGRGSIAINAQNIEIAGFSELASGILENLESGDGIVGAITLKATDKVTIDDSLVGSQVNNGAIGNSGDIKIDAQSLDLVNGAFVFTRTNGQGDTGNIIFDIRDDVTLEGRSSGDFPFASDIFNQIQSDGKGNGGDIKIEARSLSLADGANIQATTNGIGNAGHIVVRVNEAISLDNNSADNIGTQIRTAVEAGAFGNGGTIDLQAHSLSLTGGSQLIASVFRTFEDLPGGRGKGGDIIVDVSDSVNISGVGLDGFSSGIFVNTGIEAEGAAGNITVNTNFFSLADGAVINAETENSGSGGNISINANTFEAFNGGQLISTANSSGNAGSININANNFVILSGSDPTFNDRAAQFGTIVSNIGAGSGLFTQSNSTGTAGNVTIDSPQLEIQEGAEISAASVMAQGGDIVIQGLDTLQVNNSNISASTQTGRGGNLSIKTTESVQLEGIGGLLVEATEDGTAGNLTVETGQISISDGAQVSVSSPQGKAGNLSLDANSLFLNRGFITAETGNSNAEVGANIALEISDLLTINNDSQISATANGIADGGNINIDAGFIIAVPEQNSDIIARAEQGNGGEINIFTKSVFGIEQGSSTPANNTNDIDPSSDFGLDGTVDISEIEINPAEALEDLPLEVINVAGLIEQNLCQQGQGSEFIITGKGGIAPSPNQTRNVEVGSVDLIDPVSVAASEKSIEVDETEQVAAEGQEIFEAQGWLVNDRGIVELVTHSTEKDSLRPQVTNSQICHRAINIDL